MMTMMIITKTTTMMMIIVMMMMIMITTKTTTTTMMMMMIITTTKAMIMIPKITATRIYSNTRFIACSIALCVCYSSFVRITRWITSVHNGCDYPFMTIYVTGHTNKQTMVALSEPIHAMHKSHRTDCAADINSAKSVV